MKNPSAVLSVLGTIALCAVGCSMVSSKMNRKFNSYELNYDTPVNSALQAKLEKIDADLRGKYGMTTEQTAVGVLDLNTLRLATIHPDREEYAASVPKIGILLAYFELHPRSGHESERADAS